MELKKKKIATINKNIVAYIYQFLKIEEMIALGKLSKKFFQALKTDYIYENLVLKEELFVERTDVSCWKDYYFKLQKIKKNYKSGKSSGSFKMNPMRGHKNYINSLGFYEDFTFFTVISGDQNGDVNYWVMEEVIDEYDEEVTREYVAKPLCKLKGPVLGIKVITAKDDKPKHFYPLFEDGSHGLVVSYSTSGDFILHKINASYQFEVIAEFSSSIPEIYQVEILKNKLFVGTNFHEGLSLNKDNSFIESWDLTTGKKAKSYVLEYPFSLFKAIESEASTRLMNESKRNLYRPYPKSLVKSFALTDDRLAVINNFDLEHKLLVNKYETSVPNIFCFELNSVKGSTQLRLTTGQYLMEIRSYKETFAVISIDSSARLLIDLYNSVKLDKRQSIVINNNDLSPYVSSFLQHILSGTRLVQMKLYDFQVFNNQIIIVTNRDKVFQFDFDQKNHLSQFTWKTTGGQVNTIQIFDTIAVCDNYKFVLAHSSSNLIEIFSSDNSTTEKQVWHYLSGGSMNVVPKSYVQHPNYTSFNEVVLSKHSIIASLGNLIRVFDFNVRK